MPNYKVELTQNVNWIQEDSIECTPVFKKVYNVINFPILNVIC